MKSKVLSTILIVLACLLVAAFIGSVIFKSVNDNKKECSHKDIVTVEGKLPTYNETGLTDGAKCANCGFVLVEQKEIPMLDATPICNHENVVTVEGKSPTYHETGLTDGVKCADCGFEVVEQKEIPVLDDFALTTETVLISNYATSKGWVNATKYSTVELCQNVTVSVLGGGNSGKFYDGNQWRLYQTEAANLVFTAAEGYAIFNIRIIYNYSNGGVLTTTDGTKTYLSNTDIVLDGEQSFTLGVGSTAEAGYGQVKITAIEIKYGAV